MNKLHLKILTFICCGLSFVNSFGDTTLLIAIPDFQREYIDNNVGTTNSNSSQK